MIQLAVTCVPQVSEVMKGVVVLTRGRYHLFSCIAVHGVMDNLATLCTYNRPMAQGALSPTRRMFQGSVPNRFDDRPVSQLALPATSRELVALAPCVDLRPEDVLILVVLDGRAKVSETVYGESGCPLTPADKDRMAAALNGMAVPPGKRDESSTVRDLHLFEGLRKMSTG